MSEVARGRASSPWRNVAKKMFVFVFLGRKDMRATLSTTHTHKHPHSHLYTLTLDTYAHSFTQTHILTYTHTYLLSRTHDHSLTHTLLIFKITAPHTESGNPRGNNDLSVGLKPPSLSPWGFFIVWNWTISVYPWFGEGERKRPSVISFGHMFWSLRDTNRFKNVNNRLRSHYLLFHVPCVSWELPLTTTDLCQAGPFWVLRSCCPGEQAQFLSTCPFRLFLKCLFLLMASFWTVQAPNIPSAWWQCWGVMRVCLASCRTEPILSVGSRAMSACQHLASFPERMR